MKLFSFMKSNAVMASLLDDVKIKHLKPAEREQVVKDFHLFDSFFFFQRAWTFICQGYSDAEVCCVWKPGGTWWNYYFPLKLTSVKRADFSYSLMAAFNMMFNHFRFVCKASAGQFKDIFHQQKKAFFFPKRKKKNSFRILQIKRLSPILPLMASSWF